MSRLIHTKSELLKLETENGVLKVVWCFWGGGEMNETRKLSFRMLQENIGVPICLITNDNVQEFVLTNTPLHSAYPYLSAVHQSDYLRSYFLHHYGGAWHDVKATMVSFDKVWQAFVDENVFLIGRPEIKGGPARVYDVEGRWLPDYWQDLISAGYWVGRPYSALSSELFQNMTTFLDTNMTSLKRYPAKHPREKKIEKKFFISKFLKKLSYLSQGRNIHYPLPWTLFGNIFHPVNYRFRNNILKTLPCDTVKNAGVRHR
ncbi:capsular polysaccharide synthesis protein [Belliella sp. R4-6]|uniref:Capsular polysaccharide synthesis protein n=1 Tax=Belliella alkalica TaxID=1730871 RepID=A0ABS9VH88_9BACT|nr:capsular polysaccharide synthesis protein [Belliella alkalica]MCH7415801.1 capsular polysaccharide synthesis protein [Belliella alkalica]